MRVLLSTFVPRELCSHSLFCSDSLSLVEISPKPIGKRNHRPSILFINLAVPVSTPIHLPAVCFFIVIRQCVISIHISLLTAINSPLPDSHMSTTAPKVAPFMSDKRGLSYGAPAGRQPSWDSVHALADSMQKMNVRSPPAASGAPKQRRESQSDSSSESAAIVTPIPSKDVEPVNGKEGPEGQGPQLQGNQYQPQHVTPSYQYRGPIAPGTLGKQDEVLQVDYNLQPRHFIPGSITSPPMMNNGPPPRSNPPSFAQNPQNGPNGPSPNFPSVPQPPNLANFYGQNGPNTGYPNNVPSAADKAAQDIAAQIALTNALQGLNVHQQPPLNPAALAVAAAAAGYRNPSLLPGLYSNPLYGATGQSPGAPQFYPGQEGMAQAVANAVASLPPAAFHAALQQAGLAAYPVSGMPGQSQGGPSANNRKLGLYKTELCRSWEEKGSCRYGPKCQFAHGEEELKRVQRHPKVYLFVFSRPFDR